MITPGQIRAARGLLRWSQGELGERAGISVPAIANIELEKQQPTIATLDKIERALVSAGIEFLANGGVCPKEVDFTVYKGKTGFSQFMDDVYETAREVGGEICLHNAKPSHWDNWLGDEWFEMHKKRMTALKSSYKLKITCVEGDMLETTSSSYAEYRWVPRNLFNDRAFYCYGPKLAFLNVSEADVHILVLNQAEFAEGFRGIFDIVWQNAARTPDGIIK